MTGAMALDGVMAVAELADIGWSRYERIAERRTASDVAGDETAVLEAMLTDEKAECRRLRAILDEYEKTLKELREKTAGVKWMDDTPEGTDDFFQCLQQRISAPDFVAKLQAPPEMAEGVQTKHSEEDGYEVKMCAEDDCGWWEWVLANDAQSHAVESSDQLDGSGYIVVDNTDVIDGIAHFVARYVATHPDTKGLTPEQLQKAMVTAMNELRSQGTFRKMWDWGKFFYTYGSWVPTVLSVYRNPLLVRTALIGAYTSTCILARIFRTGI